MKKGKHEYGPDAESRERALEWFVRKSDGLTPSRQRRLQEQCEQDPQLREELERFDEVQSLIRRLDPGKAHEVLYEDNAFEEFSGKRPKITSRLAWSLAIAAMLTLAFTVFWKFGTTAMPASSEVVATDTEPDTKLLKDGSLVRLNKLSVINTHYTEQERSVVLHDGEVFFTVKSDPNRPFVVYVDGIKVRAVGTAFNVRKNGNWIDVTVTEGVVQLDPMESKQDPNPEATRSDLHLVRSGHSVEIKMDDAHKIQHMEMLQTQPEEFDKQQDWRRSLLTLEGENLFEIAKNFERKTGYRLLIANPEVGKFRIAGSFPSDDVIGFLTILENVYGIPWTQDTSGTYILGKTR